jgi:nucleoside-diphosphate-sugar epimerase
MRPSNAHGSFQKTGMASTFVSIFTDCDVAGELFIVYADETQARNMYVTDCAGLTPEATLSNKITGVVLNPVTGTNISVNEFVERSTRSE